MRKEFWRDLLETLGSLCDRFNDFTENNMMIISLVYPVIVILIGVTITVLLRR
ncbi:hypothetical protein [Lentilactobacillus farraginis]|uniref:hypothetical protein n=1 Tax=Lentilactobacillus farraginis TaxID=390841 RepID=UPI000AE890D6|nr:hypothetical protein [Lentilactobacillus farraginis]